MSRLRLALAQINTVVGDIVGNVQIVERALSRARQQAAYEAINSAA